MNTPSYYYNNQTPPVNMTRRDRRREEVSESESGSSGSSVYSETSSSSGDDSGSCLTESEYDSESSCDGSDETGSDDSQSESGSGSDDGSESESEEEEIVISKPKKRDSKEKSKKIAKDEPVREEKKVPVAKMVEKKEKSGKEIKKDEKKEPREKSGKHSKKKERKEIIKEKEPKRKSKKVPDSPPSSSEDESTDEAPVSTPTMSPGQYIFGVISNVIETNDKKSFKGILSRTPLPIVLHYFHHIAHKAISTGNEGMEKVVLSMNKKYNIISTVYIDAFKKGERGMITMVMDYFTKTVEAFKTNPNVNLEELLKYFTPEFIAMNLIQSGNIDSYDDVISNLKKDDIIFCRGFHAAKPLIASYFGIKNFFSNQKRYTFNREIIVFAICGGSTDTLDYILKKTKTRVVRDDIILEARSCHPVSPVMVEHLRDVYDAEGL